MERLTKYIGSRAATIGDMGNLMDLRKVVDKLAAYEDAEEQGRLKIFPVKKGQQVFYIGMQGYTTPAVYSTVIDDVGMHYFRVYDGSFYFDDIGKTIFLTEEAAQEALRKEATQ